MFDEWSTHIHFACLDFGVARVLPLGFPTRRKGSLWDTQPVFVWAWA